MCLQVLPAILSAAGAGAQLINTQQAQRQQDRIASDTLRRNAEANRRGGERVSQEIANVAKSDASGEEAAANADFLRALQAAKVDQGGAALGGPGGDRFADDLNLARTSVANEGKAMAGRIAAIDAPQLQRTREATSFGRAGTDLALLENQNSGQNFLDQLRLARAQPNAGVAAAGDLLSGLGSGLASRAGPYEAPATPYLGAVKRYGRPASRAFGGDVARGG